MRTCSDGPGRMVAPGVHRLAPMQRGEGIWIYSSGRGKMVAHGAWGLAVLQRGEAIWKCSSGLGRMAAPGMGGLAPTQHGEDIWRCSSGLGEWVSLGRDDMCPRSMGRASGGAQVGEGAWVSLGQTDLPSRGDGKALGAVPVGDGAWRTLRQGNPALRCAEGARVRRCEDVRATHGVTGVWGGREGKRERACRRSDSGPQSGPAKVGRGAVLPTRRARVRRHRLGEEGGVRMWGCRLYHNAIRGSWFFSWFLFFPVAPEEKGEGRADRRETALWGGAGGEDLVPPTPPPSSTFFGPHNMSPLSDWQSTPKVPRPLPLGRRTTTKQKKKFDSM